MVDSVGDLKAIYAAGITAAATAVTIHEDLHSKLLVYPLLAAPVALPAEGNPYTYGVLTEVVPVNGIAANFSIYAISVSAMSANANFVIRMTYGAGDTEHCIVSLTRGGAQVASVILRAQGLVVPANSTIKMELADSVGTSTLAVKIQYTLEV